MPAPTLTPATAAADYGVTVSQADLDDAESVMLASTSYTLADHVDVRFVAVGAVRRAWAIVASRLAERTAGDTARFVTGESERDYTYSENPDAKFAGTLSLLDGLPYELLEMGRAEWLTAPVEGSALPVTYDDYGVAFPVPLPQGW